MTRLKNSFDRKKTRLWDKEICWQHDTSHNTDAQQCRAVLQIFTPIPVSIPILILLTYKSSLSRGRAVCHNLWDQSFLNTFYRHFHSVCKSNTIHWSTLWTYRRELRYRCYKASIGWISIPVLGWILWIFRSITFNAQSWLQKSNIWI